MILLYGSPSENTDLCLLFCYFIIFPPPFISDVTASVEAVFIIIKPQRIVKFRVTENGKYNNLRIFFKTA